MLPALNPKIRVMFRGLKNITAKHSTAADRAQATPCRRTLKAGNLAILAEQRDESAHAMSAITACNGTEIYYEDWEHRPGRPFSHRWPLFGRRCASRRLQGIPSRWRGRPHFCGSHTEWRITCGI
jgi:hypothetical protein